MNIFKSTTIGGVETRNSFISSATAPRTDTYEGYITDKTLEFYGNIAKGGVGIVVTGTVAVSKDDAFAHHMLRADDDSHIPGLKSLADEVHRHGAKLLAQIGHNGTLIFIDPIGDPLGPSKIKDLASGLVAKEMTQEDIDNVVQDFGMAALRLKKAGFDGVQLHGAHGFILNKFLSPYYNKREDNYGGSIENRARIIVEILNFIKLKCGDDFPVFIKISADDLLGEDGLEFKDSFEAAKILSEAGMDAIEISAGVIGVGPGPAKSKVNSRDKEAYLREYAEKVAGSISASVIMVGGIRSLDVAQEVLEETMIQGISLSRPLINDPELINRWKNGSTERSRCVSCNQCFTTDITRCILNK